MDNEEVKTKATEEPTGLRKLAPVDFDEEMDAIKSGITHVFTKTKTGDGPIPADEALKGSFRGGLNTIATLIKAAAPAAAPKPQKPAIPQIKVEFQPDEPEPEPVVAETPASDEGTDEGKKEATIGKAAQRSKDAIKNGVNAVLSERNRSLGRAAADVTSSGFVDAAAGVAQAFKDVSGAINAKAPRTGAALGKIGSAAAGTVGGAAKLVGYGLKAAGQTTVSAAKNLKDSGAAEEAKEKLGQAAGSAAKSCAEGLKKTSAGISTAASATAEGFKKASLCLEKNFVALQKKAIKTAEEHMANSDGTGSAIEKLTELRDKAAAGFSALSKQAAEAGKKAVSPENTAAVGEKLKSFTAGITDAAKSAADKAKDAVSAEKTAAVGDKIKSFTAGISDAAKSAADKAKGAVSAEKTAAVSEKFKSFTASLSDKAKSAADIAREKAERFYGPEDENAPTAAEKFSALKNIATNRAHDLAAAAREKIAGLRAEKAAAPEAEEPAQQPDVAPLPEIIPEIEEDDDEQYITQESADAEALRDALMNSKK